MASNKYGPWRQDKKKYNPRAGGVLLFFIISTLILYKIYQDQLLPMPLLIFGIFLALIVLVSVYWLLPPETKEFKVIPIKRRK
jgi:hypothetical protein